MDAEYCHKCGMLHDPSNGDCQGCQLIHENEEFRQLLKESSLLISKQVTYGTWLNSIRQKAYDFNAKMHKDFADWFKGEPQYNAPA